MIQSIWQVDFEIVGGVRDGDVVRLLSVGDYVSAEPTIAPSQSSQVSTSIGRTWGNAVATGGTMQRISLSRYTIYDSLAAARSAGLARAALFPFGETGNLRVAITGGATWLYTDAVLESIAPTYVLENRGGMALLESYSGICGVGSYVAGTLPAGLPAVHEYLSTAVESIATNHENIATL